MGVWFGERKATFYVVVGLSVVLCLLPSALCSKVCSLERDNIGVLISVFVSKVSSI